MEFFGGVFGVNVILLEILERKMKNVVLWEGVSFVNNIKYESDCLWVWKVYNIGFGKIVFWSKFDVFVIEKEMFLIVDFGNERIM